MDDRTKTLLRDLAEWRPPAGVISVYLDIDPGDRGSGWRIELEHGVDRLRGSKTIDARELQPAIDRIVARFPGDAPLPSGRTHVGFIELGQDGREEWRDFQTPLGRTIVEHGASPSLAPLVTLLARGGTLGVVLLSAESARVLEWQQGRLADLGAWELDVNDYDWRELRSPQRNPQRDGTGTSSAGRDQHEQRLRDSRERFLKEFGGLVAGRFGDRGWECIVVFGDGDLPGHFQAGIGKLASRVHVVQRSLIRASEAELLEQVAGEQEEVVALREQALLARLDEAIGTDSGAALGRSDVLGALEQARVYHLVIAPSGGGAGSPAEVETMIRLGLTSGATVTPLATDEATERLARHEGAAALLRY